MTQTLNRRTTLFLLTACLLALALVGSIERLTTPWRFATARKPPEAAALIYALGNDRTAEEITAINQIAQVIYNEARGIPDKAEQAAKSSSATERAIIRVQMNRYFRRSPTAFAEIVDDGIIDDEKEKIKNSGAISQCGRLDEILAACDKK